MHSCQYKNMANNESLADRTLRIYNFNGNKISRDLLYELFLQAGPIVNVVHRSNHAFIEYADECSVAYALAFFEGIRLYNEPLSIEAKNPNPHTYRYVNALRNFRRCRDEDPEKFVRMFNEANRQRR